MASWSTGTSSVSAVDATYGQRSVFGAICVGQSTAPADDDDLLCEDEQEALAYLQHVQAEAHKIPHVVLAPLYGPQAFPPSTEAVSFETPAAPHRPFLESSAAINKKRRRRRRLRHWDELDDGIPAPSNKKRRTALGQTQTVGLSYDEEGSNADDTQDIAEANGRHGYGDGYDDNAGWSSHDDDNEDDDAFGPEDVMKPPGLPRQTRSAVYNPIGDPRGYYADGAYVATPDDEPTASRTDCTTTLAREAAPTSTIEFDDGDNDEARDARFTAAYRARLLVHFASLRAVLAVDATSDAVAALPADHDTVVGTLSARSGAFQRWLHLLQTTDPLPVQVAALDKLSVLRVLRVLLRGLLAVGTGGTAASRSSRSSRSGRFLQSLTGGAYSRTGKQRGALDLTPRTSRWLWALLARLPERGALDHREIGYVRDVAKQAVLRLARLGYDVSSLEGAGNGQGLYAEEDGILERDNGAEDSPVDDSHGEVDLEEEAAMDLESMSDEGEDSAATDHGVATSSKQQQQPDERGQAESAAEQDGDNGNVRNAAGATNGNEDGSGDVDGREDKGDGGDGNDGGDDDTGDDMLQRATLEMVLAVVGEFYGQRDLLTFRSPWPKRLLKKKP